jgi:hypothetical protein
MTPLHQSLGESPDAEDLRARLDALPDILFMLDGAGTILECVGGDPADLTCPRPRLIGKRITTCPFGDAGSRFGEALASA